ncbi:hypothetical protein VCR4J5_740048 [Vibrio crassostreae]|uniref:Uncharacterized protein n=1 Tax=Vibrio crassostreae TaxID=246167 RepID=A0ABP1X0C6_9VIBR|nr:hypothetical protein VCR19J5_260064 [Vibrio crassostreae]CDT54413.1 hypothetical protein VCR9J2_730059 [Vibrio crassostreae]CDT61648.1 hypothetical protein VCR4J5_740048 [Vibrio crassostreae]
MTSNAINKIDLSFLAQDPTPSIYIVNPHFNIRKPRIDLI